MTGVLVRGVHSQADKAIQARLNELWARGWVLTPTVPLRFYPVAAIQTCTADYPDFLALDKDGGGLWWRHKVKYKTASVEVNSLGRQLEISSE